MYLFIKNNLNITVQKIKICAIDNDKSILFLLQLLLKRIDSELEYITFDDGREAFAFIAENAHDIKALPHIILLDLDMDEMNGWAFLDAYEGMMEKIVRKIDLYIHSSSQEERDITRANAHHLVSAYLDKPVNEDILVQMISAAKAQKN
jgi:CheY-like chemotaxis protein